MTDSMNLGDELADIEALVRDAGGYVGASEDLRPRVLESVRAERRRRVVSQYAVVAAPAMALLMIVGASQVGSAGGDLEQASARAQVDRALESRLNTRRLGVDGLVWSVADAFGEVRSRQAAALNGAASDENSAQIDEADDSE